MNYVKGISEKQRILLVYDEDYKTWNGKKFRQSTRDKIKGYQLKQSYKSKYIPVFKEEKKTHQETFDDFVKLANELRTDSIIDGRPALVNLYKTGGFTKTALKIFFDNCNKQKIHPEPISTEEAGWINESSIGALIYANEGYRGKAYEYDFRSYYQSIMRDYLFKIPIKAGEFRTLSTDEFKQMTTTFFFFGIYRVKITNDNSLRARKLFRFNRHHKYTVYH